MIARPGPAHSLHPVDAVQPLDDVHSTLARTIQLPKITCPGDHQDCVNFGGKIVCDIDAASLKSLFEFQAKGGHPAAAFHAWCDANPGHEMIITSHSCCLRATPKGASRSPAGP